MSRLLLLSSIALLWLPSTSVAEETDDSNPWFQRRASQLKQKIAKEGGESITRVGGSYYGDAALAVAESLPNLERVQCLCHGYVTDKGLSALRGKQKLYDVYAAGHFTDEGVKVLATLPNLKQVMLRSSHLTDETARTLATIKTLERIKLSKTQISEQAIEDLKKALPKCKVSISSVTTASK